MAVYLTDAPAGGALTLSSTIAVDGPALFLWGTLLALALGSVLMIADRSVEPGGAFVAQAAIRPGTVQDREQRLGAHPARRDAARFQMQTEVFPLTLFALGGMMVFCSANDLLTMFVALEVLSLPLYLMCGLARRRRLLSQEAAVKYFLLGAFASAFFLYGLALLYGYAGSVRLADIANAAAGSDRSDTLLFGGMALLIVGLLFKGSVGPFHAWTPDVYQGAPTPVTAFMAACTKVAAFGGILRVLSVGLESTQLGVARRAVGRGDRVDGHRRGAGPDPDRHQADDRVLVGGARRLPADRRDRADAGGPVVDAVLPAGVRLHHGGRVRRDLAWCATPTARRRTCPSGRAWRSGRRWWRRVFTFLLLALAGIPLTSGFIGKFVVFSAALSDGMAPLVVVALVASAVAAFFYLRVIVLMYFSEPAPDGPTVTVPGAFTTAAITLAWWSRCCSGLIPAFALDWANAGNFALQ